MASEVLPEDERMSPNQDRNTDETESTSAEEISAEDGRFEESTEKSYTRRTALIGAGLGLGLFHGRGRRPQGRGARRWNQDVDANGNNLLNLGGVNMVTMDEETIITDFVGPNLEIDDTILRVTDQLDVARVETAELAGDLTGGKRVNALVGDNLRVDDNQLNALTHWSQQDVLLEPSDDDVDGIEVKNVESPENEDLRVASDADLVLSISGGQGAVRIETGGGHEIVLDDADGAESISVEDSAGNSIKMDPTTGEVSVSANQKITLDAPEIELSADANVHIESAAIVSLLGSLITLNGGGGSPAARVSDTVNNGVIQTGSPSVLIG